MSKSIGTVLLDKLEIPIFRTEVMVAGTGAASLSAALNLKRQGVEDVLIVTDNLRGGTSRNTGSDKQTYYKLSDSTKEPDSPYLMASAIAGSGCTHGDIALVEALCSQRAFYNLVNIGVPFPHNKYGGYTGYKTDHDPASRGTSTGPFTSKMMTERLDAEVKRVNTEIFDSHDIVRLLVEDNRISGALVMDKHALKNGSFGLKIILCDYLVFGLGGPAGLFKASVYPKVHTGGIGLALEIGAEAVNLTEMQFGIASIRHRWNLSGSYQQVLPSYYSTDQDGKVRKDFLQPYFGSIEEFTEAVFLKGYQWPFDSAKVANGSSIIDLLIYIEVNVKGRRVFVDFRENPSGQSDWGDFSSENISDRAVEYLNNSNAWGDTPIERLQKLNPDSIELYRQFGIDIEAEPLEIDICAQHSNGGLAGDIWWESTNIRGLYPIGEINGTHGISRPGGSALNSGQVGAIRAAEQIAVRRMNEKPGSGEMTAGLKQQVESIITFIKSVTDSETEISPEGYRNEFRERMSLFGGMVRDIQEIGLIVSEAEAQIERACMQNVSSVDKLPLILKNRHSVIAHFCYLAAIEEYLSRGGGSRGSFIVTGSGGNEIHRLLDQRWRVRPENTELRKKIQSFRLESSAEVGGGRVTRGNYLDCRPIPDEEFWFENVWSEFKATGIIINNKEER